MLGHGAGDEATDEEGGRRAAGGGGCAQEGEVNGLGLRLEREEAAQEGGTTLEGGGGGGLFLGRMKGCGDPDPGCPRNFYCVPLLTLVKRIKKTSHY